MWYSNYSWRPGKLFDTVNRALTIFVGIHSERANIFTTGYQKWNSDDRDLLMQKVSFMEVQHSRPAFWIPKLGENLELRLLRKCLSVDTKLNVFMRETSYRVYYRTDGGLYWKVFTNFPPTFVLNGRAGHSTRETWFALERQSMLKPVIAILSSNLFWWWYTVTSNCRHLNPYDVQNFPIPRTALLDIALNGLGGDYLESIQSNSSMLARSQKQTGSTETQSFKIQKSKPIIDEIDRVLAKHYGLTEEELDFIINYDIKYRMGKETEGE